jgi:hypothetical protein
VGILPQRLMSAVHPLRTLDEGANKRPFDWERPSVQTIVRWALMLAQLVVAAFYAWTVALMWKPFLMGTTGSKMLVATIILWPVIGLIVLVRSKRSLGLDVTPTLLLLTVMQLLIVLTGTIALNRAA